MKKGFVVSRRELSADFDFDPSYDSGALEYFETREQACAFMKKEDKRWAKMLSDEELESVSIQHYCRDLETEKEFHF